MPPQIASLICICVIFYLFWRDFDINEGYSVNFWVVFIWLFFTVSRSLYDWIYLSSPAMAGDAGMNSEGNPINRAFYSALLIPGIIILVKRKFKWCLWLEKNPCVWLFFIYALVSCLWSDEPFVSFKRLIKATSTLVMALCIITEVHPYIAIGVILKRLTFILLPLSVLFIKYYPVWGRGYHMGNPVYTGACSSKNLLGALCLLSGIFFLGDLLYGSRIGPNGNQRLHKSIHLIILPMIIWLTYMANSATSLGGLVLASLLFLMAKHTYFTQMPDKIISFSLVSGLIFGVIQYFFDIKTTIIQMLGRRPDLTTRIPMWQELISMVKNPIIGFGYQGFWMGERIVTIQAEYGSEVMQAHNGYIEMYINLGFIGVFFILCWFVFGLKHIKSYLTNDFSGGILRLVIFAVVAITNYTEASFYGNSYMWFLFFLGIMSVPEQIEGKKVYLKNRQIFKKQSFQF